jgi:hypothetical protein
MTQRKTSLYITVPLSEEMLKWLEREGREAPQQMRRDVELLRKLLQGAEGELGALPLKEALRGLC